MNKTSNNSIRNSIAVPRFSNKKWERGKPVRIRIHLFRFLQRVNNLVTLTLA